MPFTQSTFLSEQMLLIIKTSSLESATRKHEAHIMTNYKMMPSYNSWLFKAHTNTQSPHIWNINEVNHLNLFKRRK